MVVVTIQKNNVFAVCKNMIYLSKKAVRSTKEVFTEALNPMAYNNKKRNRQNRCAILANPKKLN